MIKALYSPLSVLLFLAYCLPFTGALGQSSIHYFSSDSGYIISELYATVNQDTFQLIDDKEANCFAIEAIEDYNNDGYPDILVGHIHGCGGNCCRNSYSVFSFQNNQFIQTQTVGDGNYLHSEIWQEQWSIILHTNVPTEVPTRRQWVKERYVLQADSLVKIGIYKSAKVNSIESDYLPQWDSFLTTTTSTYFIHTVQKEGQSLWALANKYKTTVSAIKALNQRESDVIFIGNQLKIPTQNKEQFYLHQIAQTGETLWSISQQYNIPIALIKQINHLDNDTIKVGEYLKIPKAINRP